jgi:hypothetical protein
VRALFGAFLRRAGCRYQGAFRGWRGRFVAGLKHILRRTAAGKNNRNGRSEIRQNEAGIHGRPQAKQFVIRTKAIMTLMEPFDLNAGWPCGQSDKEDFDGSSGALSGMDLPAVGLFAQSFCPAKLRGF